MLRRHVADPPAASSFELDDDLLQNHLLGRDLVAGCIHCYELQRDAGGVGLRFPQWGPKGSGELFYVDPNGGMMAASVKVSPSLALGSVTKLFDWEKPRRGPSAMVYDVSPVDGRFLMTRPATADSDGATHISVVLNWLEELKRLVPR